MMEIDDPWLAYQFDAAVSMVGTAIENASQERQKVGSGKNAKWVRKYHMDQLLDDDFRLPRPKTAEERERDAVRALFALAQRPGSGVKILKTRKPEEADGNQTQADSE